MLTARLADHTVVYDLVTEVVHVLNPTAGLVWELGDGSTEVERLVSELAEVTGAPVDEVAADVHAYLTSLEELGLVGRKQPLDAAPSFAAVAASGAHASATFGVIDDGVVVRSDDTALIASIDSLLGSLASKRPITVTLGVRPDDRGTLVLSGHGDDRAYASAEALLEALPTALNQIAAATSTCIALHAGCVRSPSGEVVLLPAVSGSGKTTLTAGLVRVGWDYATDEAVGVRARSLLAVGYPKPLVLDPMSREVLRLAPSPSSNTAPTELRADVAIAIGDVGPVDRVVLPRYEPGALLQIELLDPPQAVVAVLEHALNLRLVGQPGLEALCELALRVPVLRLVHSDINEAVAAVTDSSSRPGE